MITIGLADDEPLFTAGLAMILDAQPDMRVVWQAIDGADAIVTSTAVKEDNPEVVAAHAKLVPAPLVRLSSTRLLPACSHSPRSSSADGIRCVPPWPHCCSDSRRICRTYWASSGPRCRASSC